MIKRVTITGADDGIDPQRLADLSKEFPFVEWGILFSHKDPGRKRFPSMDWVYELRRVNAMHPMNLSCHLCGSMVREFLVGDLTAFHFHKLKPWHMFQRVQLNTHGEPHEWKSGPVYEYIKSHASKEFIFQYDNVNTDLIEALARHQDLKNISTLFDLSHGAGLLPEDGWPKHLEFIKCGYAGGLGPDNLALEIPKINEAAGGREIWIDMETKIRSEENFDIRKVKQALEICRPLI